jgi:hypothetical protein
MKKALHDSFEFFTSPYGRGFCVPGHEGVLSQEGQEIRNAGDNDPYCREIQYGVGMV